MIKIKPMIPFLFLLAAGLVLGLAGCMVTIVHFPALAQRYDNQTVYPPVEPERVFFFPSKKDLPSDFKAVPIADLKSPDNTNWDYESLLQEFRKKAGELGANA